MSKRYERMIPESDPFEYRCCRTNLRNVPHAKTVVGGPFGSKDEIRAFLGMHIRDYPFVKLCDLSPKDWCTPVFANVDDAMVALENSQRTKDCLLGRHVVMKEARVYDTQSRCFVSEGVVTLISGNIEPQLVEDFIEEHGVPFRNCCMELGERNDTLEVIEFNQFSTRCDPDPLTWDNSWYELILGTTTIWVDPVAPSMPIIHRTIDTNNTNSTNDTIN